MIEGDMAEYEIIEFLGECQLKATFNKGAVMKNPLCDEGLSKRLEKV